MKRMFITAVSVLAASAAFAAPADAVTADAINYELQMGTACYPDEKLDTCVIRIARNAPNLVFDYAEYALYEGGRALGETIDTVDEAVATVKKFCEDKLSGCGSLVP